MLNRKLLFLSILSLLVQRATALQSLGCYSSIPSSYTSKGTYLYQTSGYCSEQCSDSDYFALTNGNECFCGSSAPSGDTSSDCTTICAGFGDEFCGSSDAFTCYAQEGVAVSHSSGSSDDDESSTSTTSSSSSKEGNTSTANSSSSDLNVKTSSSETTTGTTTSSSSPSATATSTATTDTSTTAVAIPDTSASSVEVQVLTSVVERSGSVVTSVVFVSETQAATTTSNEESTTASASASASASESSAAKSTESGGSSGSNKGAIIGGAVGGAVGGLLLLSGIIFFVRRRRRDDSFDDDTVMADDLAYEEALKSNKNPFASPDDDTYYASNAVSPDSSNKLNGNSVALGRRRLSDGSLADAADYDRKVLRVANPDDSDY